MGNTNSLCGLCNASTSHPEEITLDPNDKYVTDRNRPSTILKKNSNVQYSINVISPQQSVDKQKKVSYSLYTLFLYFILTLQ